MHFLRVTDRTFIDSEEYVHEPQLEARGQDRLTEEDSSRGSSKEDSTEG